ncbi:hypothetical protein ACFQI3_05620 [Hansschlegelia quercus]|uniref:Uncharacterized protein n=1 Tax=Hansschlegelia quercus TaxID=2528245 RepID=A0A4Q9GPU4_9HYPH|nr:hypothetical protein [Hansschlegelia quercus]TBN53950.1 hypothetical protein EYR15_09225 [Hansschlegelia quercus]
MADYFPVISRAVAGLENNTGEARRAVYERARAAIVKQLRAIDPPLSEDDIGRERMNLEEAIRRVEAEAPAPASAKTAKPLDQKPAAPRSAEPAKPQPLPKAPPPVAARPEAPRPPEAAETASSELARPEAAKGQAKIAPPVMQGPTPTKRSDGRPIIAAGSRPDAAKKKQRSAPLIALLALVLILAGTGLFLARDRIAGMLGGRSGSEVARQEQPVTETAARDQAPEAQPQDGKSDDRLPQDGAPAAPAQPANEQQTARVEPPAAAAPAAPAATDSSSPPPSQTGPLVAQRATLYEEGPNQQSGEALAGTVLWRTESVTSGQGQPLETAIRGDIEIPGRNLRATMVIRRNSDATLPASHTVEIQFDLPPDFPNAGVANVPGVVMKADESARGATVSGLSVRVTTGFFLIGLSNLDTERSVNEQLLRDRSWIDVPILYDNGRRAVLTLEKGTPGTQAFNDAFNAWRSSPAAQAQP